MEIVRPGFPRGSVGRRSQTPKIEQRQRWPPWDVPSRLVRRLWRRWCVFSGRCRRGFETGGRGGYQNFGGRYIEKQKGLPTVLFIWRISHFFQWVLEGFIGFQWCFGFLPIKPLSSLLGNVFPTDKATHFNTSKKHPPQTKKNLWVQN